MGKNLQRDLEIIKENERLEEVFRQIHQKKKNSARELKEHKNKILDVYFILVSASAKNKNLTLSLLKKMPLIVKRVMLSKKYDHLKKNRIFTLIHQFITNNLKEYLIFYLFYFIFYFLDCKIFE